jgi:hypothetical protein
MLKIGFFSLAESYLTTYRLYIGVSLSGLTRIISILPSTSAMNLLVSSRSKALKVLVS